MIYARKIENLQERFDKAENQMFRLIDQIKKEGYEVTEICVTGDFYRRILWQAEYKRKRIADKVRKGLMTMPQGWTADHLIFSVKDVEKWLGFPIAKSNFVGVKYKGLVITEKQIFPELSRNQFKEKKEEREYKKIKAEEKLKQPFLGGNPIYIGPLVEPKPGTKIITLGGE